MVSKLHEVNFTEIYFGQKVQNTNKRVLSCEKAIDEIGHGKVQILVFVSTFLILGNTLSETMGISYLIPAAICDLHLTSSDKGFLTGITFFGVMAGSHIFGFLADTKGRRVVVLWALLGSTLSTWLSVFIKDFTVFLTLRFISGFFVAGYSAIMYAYLGEYNTNKHRASILSWVTTSVGFASTVMSLLAFWILRYEWRFELYEGYEFRPWRLLIFLYSSMGLFGGIILLYLKESPRFLLSLKKDDEALEVIKWMYRTNKGTKTDDDLQILKLESEPSEIAKRDEKGLKSFLMSVGDQTFSLFKPPHVKYFLTCCCLHMGVFAVSGAIALFMPDILNKLAIVRSELGHDIRVCEIYDVSKDILGNNSSQTDSFICNDVVDLSIYVQSIFVGIGYIFGFVIISIVVKPHTRVYILVFNYTVAAVSGIVLTFLTSSYAIVALFTMFVFFAGVNVPVVNSAAVDIFPTYLRSMAICCSMMFGRLGTTISTNVLGMTLESSCEASFYAFSGICVFCCIISFVLPRQKSG